jgi:GAF domain-containing protein
MTEEELRVANEELKQNYERSTMMAEISQILADTGTNYTGVIQAIVQKTAESIGDASILRLFSEENRQLDEVAFYHPRPDRLRLLEKRLTKGQGDLEKLLSHEVFKLGFGKSQESSISTAENFGEQWELDSGSFSVQNTSAIAVPLRLKDRVIGVLSLIRDQFGQTYNLDDLVILQDLADRAAMAVFNARLYRDLEKSLATEKLIPPLPGS